jgi:3alpha(or 20beta)-hydroxysteroid dehydrogenase
VLRWKSRIDILINNAGILARKTIVTYDEAAWRRVLDVNVTASFLGIQKVAARMCRPAQRESAMEVLASVERDCNAAAKSWNAYELAALYTAGIRIRITCAAA